MYNCIIFDVDGTLIDTEPAVISSYQKVIFEEFGRYFTTEELMQGSTLPTHKRLERLGFKNVDKAVKKFHTNLIEAFSNVKAFDGILKVLDFLDSKNVTIGIVTARSKNEVDDDPCLQNLIKRFKHVICADDTCKHKPDPEPILQLMKMANTEISRTIYIGDTYSDYMCARNSGVHFGLALWGAKSTDHINADYNFRNPEDIMDIFLK